MDKMSPDRLLTRRGFLRAAATAAAGSLVACLPRSTAIPTPESQSTPVPTAVLPTEVPFTPEPPVDLTAEAIKRTLLNSNLTDVSGDVLLQGIGGEISGDFGDPKITNPLTVTQIEATRVMLGQKNAGTLYAVAGGKAVIQRLTGVKDGIDYTNLPDAEVPFKVTITMLPNTFLQTDGERIILPEKTKPGEARYIKTNDQTEWNVTSTFLVDPGFLPTGAAFWWDMSGMNLRPVMWDGNGNPRLMENIPVEVKLATVTPTAVPTETATPTAELMNINIDLKNVDVDKLPVITMSDIESGKLTETELALYNSGKVKKISPVAVPIKTSSYIVVTPPGISLMGLPSGSSEYADFSNKPETRSYVPVSINTIVIDGKKLLIFGEAYLNTNGSIGILHYGFENVGDPYYLDQVKRTMGGEFYVSPVITVTEYNHKWINSRLEPTMVKLYEKGNEERLALINEYVATGNIPEDLSKMLLYPGMDPMQLPH